MNKVHKHHSLRTKLTWAFGFLGLLPVIFFGVISLYVINITHQQDVWTMELQLLRQKNVEMQKFLGDISGLFEITVGYKSASVITDRDQKFLLESLLQNPVIEEVSFADMTGQETQKISNLQDETQVPLLNVSKLASFSTAAKGQIYFGPVEQTLSGPMLTVSGPVTNESGEVVMVATGKISLASLVKSALEAKLGSSGYLYIVNASGEVVGSSVQSYLPKNLIGNAWLKTLNYQTNNGEITADGDAPKLAGVPVLAAAVGFKNLDWILVAEWPKDDAFLVVNEIRNQVLEVLSITLLFVLLMGWFVGRLILKPLSELEKGAKKIGSGEFGYKVSLHTDDELEDMGEVFNKMGDDLKLLDNLKTAQIRAKALAESLEKERALSRTKEELLRNASHQLRTPLSIANWNAELLEKASNLEEQRPLRNNLKTGLNQLSIIVHDLITVSDLGVGFKNTMAAKVDLAELLTKCHISKQKQITEKQLVWQEAVEPNLPKITGHLIFLPAVFDNLFDNAITYSKTGGTVQVVLEHDGGNIHFSIADNGIGVTEKDKDLIFTQFFRATNAIDKKNVGTGLGLYICKTIIEGHGGKIWMESREGQGTTVHFLLPVN